MNSQGVEPRPAATVVLLRDGVPGLEVFLQRRVAGMAFAAGMTVFPGGRVDQTDRRSAPPGGWHGPGPDALAGRLGCPPAAAGAVVVAAVRETCEESGVLLAGEDGASLLTDGATLRGCRTALHAGTALLDVLADAGLVLRADLLMPWAEWITPAGEPRRYDTWFFLAAMPEGQTADGATGEVAAAGWTPVPTALEHWRAGRIRLMPPTWVTLEQLAPQPDVASALAAAEGRPVAPIMPSLRRDGDKIEIVLPDGIP